MIHSKNCEHEYFEAITKGLKLFEVRKEDEACCFLVGDFLALNEIDGVGGSLTGKCCLTEITYVLRDPRFVKEGFCVLGIKPCKISRSSDRFFHNDDVFSTPVYDSPAIRAQMEGIS